MTEKNEQIDKLVKQHYLLNQTVTRIEREKEFSFK
jgi:hypothetical protein